jgi:GTPase
LKKLSNLYRRKTPPSSVVTPELARSVTELALEINREVSLLLDRRGRVVTVSVGDASKTEFPNLDRGREAESRLRGLWLVHAHPKLNAPLSKGDLSTLFLNRLDAIVALETRADGIPGAAHLAHLTPPNASLEEEDWRVYPPQTVQQLEDWDVVANTRALESEFARQEKARETKKSSEERAILVQIDRGSGVNAEEALEELSELARTAGATVVWKELTYRKHAKADTLIGRGKLEELTSRAYHLDADVLIFGEELSPAQAREIENATSLKIIDRTQLILDIFAQHASGQESAQQVELAQLRYMKPRLLGQGTKLSKIGGGAAGSGGAIGTRGPGETKLELDRRRINDRIAFLERGLKDLSQRQQEKRKNRLRSGVPVIGIVGYTNAGKSTLLNALTHSSVLAENKLFATLAPTSRRGYIPDYGEVVFTDTVGFIRELPADLKRAFRSTLEELKDVDLLLHVLDASTDGALERYEAVEDILAELDLGAVPKLLVLNKIDRADAFDVDNLLERLGGIAVSGAQKLGLNDLKTAVMQNVLHHRAMQAATLETERARQLEYA